MGSKRSDFQDVNIVMIYVEHFESFQKKILKVLFAFEPFIPSYFKRANKIKFMEQKLQIVIVK